MAKSLVNVQLQVPGQGGAGKNVLAQPNSSTGQTAISAAIDAAIAAVGQGAQFQTANVLGGKPVDLSIAQAQAPAVDGPVKAVYMVQFQVGSGPSGASPAPLMVLSNPQTNGNMTTPASDLAISAAAGAAGATPSGVNLLGTVDIDATA